MEVPLEISSSKEKKTFVLALKGILQKVKRDPLTNPHGLLITAFAFTKTPISK